MQICNYRPINSYGVIGDCHSVVLVSPDGSVDWGCLPDFDSPALFCRLLDAERGGYFQIAPTDKTIPGFQRYLRGSNVLQTKFTSTMGEVAITDFMPVETLSAWPYRGMNNNTWTREDGSCHCLVRSVECTHGELPITVTLKVTPNYAASPSEITLAQHNLGALITGGQQYVGLGIVGAYRASSFSMIVVQNEGDVHPELIVQMALREGERIVFALGVGRNAQAARRLVDVELHQRNFDVELTHTLHCWRKWISGCTYYGPYAEEVQRSALALKMMTYAPTGAIVAAPTTSLPEDLNGVRNWDYRYTWLRDATFTLYALNVLGFTEEARAFTHWLRRLSYANGEDLQIMYGIRGERELTERELPHLSGYCDSHPVRIGNGAADQKQLDVFGEVLDCIHIYRRQGGFERYGETLNGPLWAMMQTLVEHVCAHWQEPDCGIWEVRGELRHFVYSKVMCWVALDRILEQLTDENGFVYRYISEDGLTGSEGTFTICSFWLVDNLAMQGRLAEARSLFERLLSYAGRLGLFSEEIDSHRNMALGNYPQAFTHIALINSAINMQKAEMRLAEHHTEPVIAAIKLQNNNGQVDS